MNGNDIFIALEAVADSDIAQALELVEKPVKRWIAVAAAACLVIGIGAAMATVLPRLAGKPSGQHTVEAVPTNTANETEPAALEPTEEPRVIYASSEEYVSGSVLKRGDLFISEALLKAMDDEANANCLFAVKIMCRACDKEEAYVEAERDRLFSDPVYLQFMEEFDEWEKTYELTESERALVEKGASRREIAMERFRAIWRRENSAELAEKLDELEAQMDDWQANLTGLREYLNDCFDEERTRLEGSGYSIELNEYGQWCCKLTAEQIKAFPADSGWGYRIVWETGKHQKGTDLFGAN